MEYFNDLDDTQKIKERYKKLAKKYHPDLQQGEEEKKKATKIMSQINNEYKKLTQSKNTRNTEKAFMDIILNIIVHLPADIEIEICGTWIWVSGNTRPYKEKLKKQGFKWASKKKMWFWKPDDGGKRKPRTSTDMEIIREKYGSRKVGRNGKSATLIKTG